MRSHRYFLFGIVITGILFTSITGAITEAAPGEEVIKPVLTSAVGGGGTNPALPSIVGDGTIGRIISIGQSDNRVMDHMHYLTKEIGPRLAGTDKHRAAAEWARDKFASLGLTDPHLEKAAEVPVGFDRGVSTGSIVAPVKRELYFYTPAWSAGTHGAKRAPAVAVPASPDELRDRRASFEGAWVLRPGFTDLESYEAYRQAWDDLEVDIAGEVLPSGGEMIHASGNLQLEWDDLPKTPKVILPEKDWEDIAGMLDEGREVHLEFDIQNRFVEGPVPVYNVVADIPGKEFPDEYVIVGAHLDSWDAGEGALDNGTGVAAAIEAARILMKSEARPMRTIRFVLFAGEEVGMLGSRAYVTDHPDILPKISAVLNMDQGSDYIRGISATREMEGDFESVFAPVRYLDPDKPFEIEVAEHLPDAVECGGKVDPETKELTPGCGGGVIKIIRNGEEETISSLRPEDLAGITNLTGGNACGSTKADACGSTKVEELPEGGKVKRIAKVMGSSDHAPFLNAGIPAFTWNQSGVVPYGEFVHTQEDNYDKVVPGYEEYSATVIALSAYGIADLDHLLSRENLLAEPDEDLE